jgi:hypothetical protein
VVRIEKTRMLVVGLSVLGISPVAVIGAAGG